MSESATYHSSGSFSLDPRGTRLIGQAEPGLALLSLLQAWVLAGARQIEIVRNRTWLKLTRYGGQCPESLPAWSRCLATWKSLGWSVQLAKDETGFQVLRIQRQMTRSELQREGQLLKSRAQFCPVPVFDQGLLLQPEHYARENSRPSRIQSSFHLAEFFWFRPEDLSPGVGLLRRDSQSAGPLLNSLWTYWREIAGKTRRLCWSVPQRLAGVLARHRQVSGFRSHEVGLLQAIPGRENQLFCLADGVVVEERPLDWAEVSGLTLIVDVSRLPRDASGLRLVDGEEFQSYLGDLKRRTLDWIGSRSGEWTQALNSSCIHAPQLRREMGAWLLLWGGGMVTGWAAYLPLPFLGLPWIYWHHHQKRKTRQLLNARLCEFPTVMDRS